MSDEPVLFTLRCPGLGFSFRTSSLPGGVRMGKGANFNPNEIIGRSSPIQTFSNSGAMTVSVSFELHALEGDPKREVTGVVKSFLALVRPKTAGIQPPSKCYLTIPDMLDDWECVCDRVDPVVGFYPLYDESGTARNAQISVSFTEIEIENTDAKEWLGTTNYRQYPSERGTR